MKKTYSSRSKVVAELVFLAGLATLAAFLIVPVCWTSNCKNPNFTGWCISLSKLLEGGGKLYVDGTHIPLSPLPFVTLQILAPTEKVWILESSASFACLILTLLIMHVVLSRLFRGPIPLIASVTAGLWFITCTNNLLYNTMPQVFAALLCLIVLQMSSANGKKAFLLLLALSVVASLCILSKQSTGLGAFGGVCIYLVLAGTKARDHFVENLFPRFLMLLVFIIGTLIFTWTAVRLLSAYINPVGFVNDVLLHGSETKGGSKYVLKLLAKGMESTSNGLWFVLVFFLFLIGLGRRFYLWKIDCCVMQNQETTEIQTTAFSQYALFGSALTSLIVGSFMLLFFLPLGRSLNLVKRAAYLAACELDTTRMTIRLGIILTLSIAFYFILRVNRLTKVEETDNEYERGFLGVTMVAFFSLLFHSISDAGMANYLGDQAFQPFMPLAAALLIMSAAYAVQYIEQSHAAKWMRIFILLMLGCWIFGMAVPRYCEFVKFIAPCTLKPSRIQYLQSASLSPDAAGVVELSTRIRDLVPPNETVLLLPGDPNLESWFDRKRPITSCPIIFSDQYWAQYVNEDFRRLNSAPPYAIIVGPRNEMQSAYQWSFGAQKLITLVKSELLPKAYTLVYSQSFLHQGKEDFFDIYLLSLRPNKSN